MKPPIDRSLSKANDRLILKAIGMLGAMPELRSASVFQAPDFVITATRRGKCDGRAMHSELVLTVGKPNFRGRAFVKACLKAGEPFPVRKVQVRWRKGARP